MHSAIRGDLLTGMKWFGASGRLNSEEDVINSMAFESSEDTEYTPKYLCKCTNAARVDLPSLSSHCDSVYYVFSDRSMYLA